MKKCSIRFYHRLKIISGKEFYVYSFIGKRTLMDIIESLGVPHTEIYLILKNDQISGFKDFVLDSDRISLYPKMFVFYKEIYRNIMLGNYSHKIKKEYWYKYQNYHIHQFIADVHLGKLVKYLRFLGIDILYNPLWNDEELINISQTQKRILLTQDKGILKQRRVKYGFYLISREPKNQLKEFLEYFDIMLKPFSRCSLCNHTLNSLHRKDLENFISNIPEMVLKKYTNYYYCNHCNKIYWEGSHYENIIKIFNKINIL
jgi:uncharacterized protein with PIN domain